MVAGWEGVLAIIPKSISFIFPAVFTGFSFLPDVRRSAVAFLAMNSTISQLFPLKPPAFC